MRRAAQETEMRTRIEFIGGYYSQIQEVIIIVIVIIIFIMTIFVIILIFPFVSLRNPGCY